MEIRLFTPSDTETLVDLLCDMSRHYNGADGSSRDTVKKNLTDNIIGNSDVRIVVAVSQGRAVGVATIAILYPAPKERGQLFMKELYVASDARSKGTGQKLMVWIAAYALKMNCVRFDWTVDLDNAKALAFYHSLGATHVRDKLYFRLSGADLASFAERSEGLLRS
jgi:GNAT superfamily N-acetyltransferase